MRRRTPFPCVANDDNNADGGDDDDDDAGLCDGGRGMEASMTHPWHSLLESLTPPTLLLLLPASSSSSLTTTRRRWWQAPIALFAALVALAMVIHTHVIDGAIAKSVLVTTFSLLPIIALLAALRRVSPSMARRLVTFWWASTPLLILYAMLARQPELTYRTTIDDVTSTLRTLKITIDPPGRCRLSPPPSMALLTTSFTVPDHSTSHTTLAMTMPAPGTLLRISLRCLNSPSSLHTPWLNVTTNLTVATASSPPSTTAQAVAATLSILRNPVLMPIRRLIHLVTSTSTFTAVYFIWPLASIISSRLLTLYDTQKNRIRRRRRQQKRYKQSNAHLLTRTTAANGSLASPWSSFTQPRSINPPPPPPPPPDPTLLEACTSTSPSTQRKRRSRSMAPFANTPPPTTNPAPTSEDDDDGGPLRQPLNVSALGGRRRRLLLRCVRSHVPVRADEVRLRRDEVVLVFDVFEDGWGFGRARAGVGAFPMACLVVDEENAASVVVAATTDADVDVRRREAVGGAVGVSGGGGGGQSSSSPRTPPSLTVQKQQQQPSEWLFGSRGKVLKARTLPGRSAFSATVSSPPDSVAPSPTSSSSPSTTPFDDDDDVHDDEVDGGGIVVVGEEGLRRRRRRRLARIRPGLRDSFLGHDHAFLGGPSVIHRRKSME